MYCSRQNRRLLPEAKMPQIYEILYFEKIKFFKTFTQRFRSFPSIQKYITVISELHKGSSSRQLILFCYCSSSYYFGARSIVSVSLRGTRPQGRERRKNERTKRGRIEREACDGCLILPRLFLSLSLPFLGLSCRLFLFFVLLFS